MPYADIDDIEIFYEVFGEPGAPVLVLISGGGAQLLSWDVEFIELLVGAGLRVVRFDNRDTGFSHRFGGESDLDGGYELSDMALDVLRVLDHIGVESAHLVGHSMGGMMAQMLAIEHPDRVRSIGLLSTLPGQSSRYVAHEPRPELQQPPVRVTREQAIAFTEYLLSVAPPGRYDPQREWHLHATAVAYDRGYAPEGYARQWAALLRAPERLEALHGVTVPAFIFHGRDDDVVRWYAAVDMAEALTDSELHVVPEVGHLIPHELWPEIVGGIVRTAQRADHPVSEHGGAHS